MAEAPNKRQRSARIQKKKEEAAMASAEASEDAKATEAEELADALRIVDALKASENGCYKTKIAVAVSLSFVSLDEELTALKLKGATEQRGEEEQQEQEARLEVELDDEDDEEEKSPRTIPPDEFATFENELEEEDEVHDTATDTRGGGLSRAAQLMMRRRKRRQLCRSMSLSRFLSPWTPQRLEDELAAQRTSEKWFVGSEKYDEELKTKSIQDFFDVTKEESETAVDQFMNTWLQMYEINRRRTTMESRFAWSFLESLISNRDTTFNPISDRSVTSSVSHSSPSRCVDEIRERLISGEVMVGFINKRLQRSVNDGIRRHLSTSEDDAAHCDDEGEDDEPIEVDMTLQVLALLDRIMDARQDDEDDEDSDLSENPSDDEDRCNDDESSSDNDADDHDDDDSEAADAGDSAEKTRKKEERKSTLVGECCSRREDCYENQNQNLWRKKSRRRTAGSRSVVLFLRVGVGSLRLQCKKFEIEKSTVQRQRPLRWSSIGAREGHYLLCSLLLEPCFRTVPGGDIAP